jgi:tetratricopeptide (TPR) repeat protein
MRPTAIFLLPALVLPLTAGETAPLTQRLQQSLRLPGSELDKLQAELAAAPEQADKTYWQALVAYARLGQAKNGTTSAALLAEATRCLNGRTDADSFALEGSLCGMAISLHPEQAMELVTKAMSCFDRAKQLAPNNPRVRFFEAVHVFHTPEAFGGGPDAALPLLEATVALAEAEPAAANPWLPAWGRAEALAWLALAEAKTHRMPQAKAHLDRCFKIDPGYGFARTFVAPLVP